MIKIKAPKKDLFLPIALSCIALIFIITSTTLIVKVDSARDKIENNVQSIGVLSQIESTTFKFLASDQEMNSDTFKTNIRELLAKSDDSYIVLIEKLVGDIETVTSRSELYSKAVELDFLCKNLVMKKRVELSSLSQSLAKYWTSLYLFIGFACITCVVLSLVSIKSFRAKKMMLNLQNQNQLFLNSSIDSVMSCDFSGRIIELNSATENMFGYTRKELLGRSINTLYGSVKDMNRVQSSILKTGSFSGEISNRHKNGTFFYSYLSANLVFDLNGKKIGVMGVSRNISKQKQLEDQFQHIVKNASDIIFTTDINGVISYVNEAAIGLFDRTIEELIGMNVSNIVANEHVDMVSRQYEKQIKDKVAESYLEFKIISKSGEKKWVGQNVRLVYDNVETNKVVGFNGIQRNINERKVAELKLEVSEKNFRLISDTINDVFFLYNLSTDSYEYVSSNCSKVLGVTEDYFYRGAKYVKEYVLPEDKEIVMSAFERLSKGDPYNIDYRIVIDSKVLWLNECAFPIFDRSGAVIKNSGTCRDITESVLAKSIIDKQNVEIAESIQYSKIILDSTLPTKDEINEILPDSFVLSRPKSIISGDFYIVDTIQVERGLSYKVFIVGDCTGHGVPGGILSILCSSLLKDSFGNKHVNSPADALNLVREKLIKFFRSSQSRTVREGMDIAFCALNERDNILHYSGAKNSCILVRKDELFEYKGDSQHVGYSSVKMPFTEHKIEVKDGDIIYLYSDGYMDQFGGPKNKKFMKRKFRELLYSLRHLTLKEQESELSTILSDWQGDKEQTDDITVLGAKISITSSSNSFQEKNQFEAAQE
ncbi:MAG: PAS domain S-box protein [Crocinitomicaceae bacterium]